MKLEGYFDEHLSPRIEITLRGRSKRRRVWVVVDTGFNGELLLPRSLLEDLGFRYSMTSEAELADGSIVETTLYSGTIRWFGEERTVQVVASESEDGLLGTEMLFGVTLFMDLDEDRVILERKEDSSQRV